MFFLPSFEAISYSVSRAQLQVDQSVCSKYPQLINHKSIINQPCMVNESSKQPGKQLWLCPGFKLITIGCYIAPKFYILKFDLCGVSYTSLSALTSKG